MADEPIVIDCHTAWTKAGLRIVTLLMPLWLIVGPIGTYSTYAYHVFQTSWYFIPYYILFPSMFILGAVAMCQLLLGYRLCIQADRIHLPSFWVARFASPTCKR